MGIPYDIWLQSGPGGPYDEPEYIGVCDKCDDYISENLHMLSGVTLCQDCYDELRKEEDDE